MSSFESAETAAAAAPVPQPAPPSLISLQCCSSATNNHAPCISFEALAAALRHPALSSSPRTVCTLLQVCKAWRSAVLAADACHTVISTSAADSAAPLHHISNLAALATWLPRHAGCVAAISLHVPHQHSVQRTGCADRQTYTAAVQALLQLSLQAACQPAPAAASSCINRQQQQQQPASPPTAGQDGQQQHQEAACLHSATRRLQLQSFSSNFLTSPAMLAALPADSLTRLQLMALISDTSSSSSSNSSSNADGNTQLAAALARLSSLRQLQLGFAGAAAASCLAGLVSLQQLTRLEVSGSIRSSKSLLLLPRRLQHLSIQWDSSSSSGEPAAAATGLALAHLTALSALDLDLVAATMATTATAEAQLPAQLGALTITYSAARAPSQSVTVGDDGCSSWLAGLSQLRKLRLRRSVECAQQLLRLPGLLPALQQLSLEYCRSESAVAAAAAWRHLPQLQELQVWCSGASTTELAAITAGVAAATSLTALELQDHVLPPDSTAAEACRQMQLLQHLAGLGQLQRLVVVGPWPAAASDVAALTQQLPRLRHVQCEALGSVGGSSGQGGQQLQDALAAVVTNLMAWAGP